MIETNENLNQPKKSWHNYTDAAQEQPAKVASLEILAINKAEIFNKEECQEVLNECVDELWLPATVVGQNKLHSAKRQKLRGDIEGFPFINIRDITKHANMQVFDFSLMGIIDQDFPQVYRYDQNDFYNMHIDLTPMAPSRKITFLINLSDPDTYEGGDIEFLNVDIDTAITREQGNCLVFPSFMPYSITPVTKGTKHLIVGHVHGAIFK